MSEHSPSPTPARAECSFALFLLSHTLFIYLIYAHWPYSILQDKLGLHYLPDKYFKIQDDNLPCFANTTDQETVNEIMEHSDNDESDVEIIAQGENNLSGIDVFNALNYALSYRTILEDFVNWENILEEEKDEQDNAVSSTIHGILIQEYQFKNFNKM